MYPQLHKKCKNKILSGTINHLNHTFGLGITAGIVLSRVASCGFGGPLWPRMSVVLGSPFGPGRPSSSGVPCGPGCPLRPRVSVVLGSPLRPRAPVFFGCSLRPRVSLPSSQESSGCPRRECSGWRRAPQTDFTFQFVHGGNGPAERAPAWTVSLPRSVHGGNVQAGRRSPWTDSAPKSVHAGNGTADRAAAWTVFPPRSVHGGKGLAGAARHGRIPCPNPSMAGTA